MKNFILMLIMPGLLLAYVLTTIEGLYVLFAILTVLSFIVSLLGLCGWIAGREAMTMEQKSDMRWKLCRKSGVRFISRLLSVAMIVGLFVLSKYVIGTLFLLTFIIMLGMAHAMESD